MVRCQSMLGRLRIGLCRERSSEPRTACSRPPAQPLDDLLDDGADDLAGRFLGPVGDHVLQRHQRADQLDVRRDLAERLRLEEELLEPLASRWRPSG